MPLDPGAHEFLETMRDAQPAVETLSAQEARAVMKRNAALMPKPELVTTTEDRAIETGTGSITVRSYRPDAAGTLPAIVYFHGGGWTVCDVEMFDAQCDRYASQVGCLVVSVEYRMGPEFKFPVAAEDCYAATQWVADQADALGVDRSRIAVAGESAGGNLAAAIALMARDRGGPALAFQLLVYPVTDCRLDPADYRSDVDTVILTTAGMAWYCQQYLEGPEDARNPYASPLLAEDLSGLPPAHVVTAEMDVLHDEGQKYAARLREAGVAVTATDYPGMFHGFFGLAGMLPQADEAQAEAIAALQNALGTA
jgi:acetyl esterase